MKSYARVRTVTVAALLIGGGWPPAGPLQAQEGCVFGEEGNDVLDRRPVPGGGTITYVSNPHFVCADGVQIWADSAVAYSAQEFSHLMGSVRYVDPTRELNADEARYFSRQERVQAQGHLYVRDVADGSVIENGDLVYLRQADFRDEESMTVTTGEDGVRPVARIRPASAADAPAPGSQPSEPYLVVADRIFLQGSERFEAMGHVEIERDSLLAFADSADYDRVGDRIVLRGSARVEGPTYDLQGRTIDLLTPEADTSEVHAVRDAVLTGEDLVISSSQIRLYLTDGALDRLVATPLPGDTVATAKPGAARPEGGDPPGRPDRPKEPVDLPGAADAVTSSTDDSLGVADPFAAATYPGQPVAIVEDFRLTADSIDVLAPGEHIERVFAGGRARSVSHARDSLNVEDLPPVARADWLEGDTVIVYFEPETAVSAYEAADSVSEPADSARAVVDPAGAAPPADSSERYRVDRIRALVNARSLYRLAPADSAARAGVDPPAVHYVVGDSITVVMDGDEVESMEVVGQTQGLHLEPLSRRAVPDSLRDTTAVRSGAAAGDTIPPADTGDVRGVLPVPDTAGLGGLPARIRVDGVAGASARWPPPSDRAPAGVPGTHHRALEPSRRRP